MSAISFRKAAGLSIRDLAELMEVSRSSIGHYEKGLRHLPTTGSLRYAQLESAWLAFCRKEAEPAIVLNEMRQTQLHQTLEMLKKERAILIFK